MTDKSKLFDYDNPQNCVTHHYACNCREAKFAKVIEAAKNVLNRDGHLGELDDAIRDFEGKK